MLNELRFFVNYSTARKKTRDQLIGTTNGRQNGSQKRKTAPAHQLRIRIRQNYSAMFTFPFLSPCCRKGILLNEKKSFGKCSRSHENARLLLVLFCRECGSKEKRLEKPASAKNMRLRWCIRFKHVRITLESGVENVRSCVCNLIFTCAFQCFLCAAQNGVETKATGQRISRYFCVIYLSSLQNSG